MKKYVQNMKKYVVSMKEYVGNMKKFRSFVLHIDSGTWKNSELPPRLWDLVTSLPALHYSQLKAHYMFPPSSITLLKTTQQLQCISVPLTSPEFNHTIFQSLLGQPLCAMTLLC